MDPAGGPPRPPPVAAQVLVSAHPGPATSDMPSGHHSSIEDLSPAEIAARLQRDPASLGSISVGRPNRGALVNGIPMPEGPLWEVADPSHSFATEETVASVTAAIEAVHASHPDSPRIYVGQMSSEHGGYLRPHRSHQSGRDVDLGYYYRGGSRWYARANAKTLDLARTWTLVKTLALDPNVETIFMDRSVQRMVREFAMGTGEGSAWLSTLFESPGNRDTLVRHEWGHLTHLHVRFRCPRAQEAGIRTHEALISTGRIPPRKYY